MVVLQHVVSVGKRYNRGCCIGSGNAYSYLDSFP
jgi:hypothetical protein